MHYLCMKSFPGSCRTVLNYFYNRMICIQVSVWLQQGVFQVHVDWRLNCPQRAQFSIVCSLSVFAGIIFSESFSTHTLAYLLAISTPLQKDCKLASFWLRNSCSVPRLWYAITSTSTRSSLGWFIIDSFTLVPSFTTFVSFCAPKSSFFIRFTPLLAWARATLAVGVGSIFDWSGKRSVHMMRKEYS